MKMILTTIITFCIHTGAFAGVTEISGVLTQDLDDVIGAGNSGQLTADTRTHWSGTTTSSDIDLNGFELELNTGNGNTQTYSGAFTGPGSLKVVGRSDASWWEGSDVWLSGTDANTPTSVWVSQGSVNLNKPAGIDALAGSITVGGSAQRAILVWNADNQINDTSSITSEATPFELKMQGNSEVFGSLTLGSRGYVDFGTGNSQVHFADSSVNDWGNNDTLLVRNWAGSATNKLAFGNDNSGLTAGQVGSIGFLDPAGHDAGLYRAQILNSGEVVPLEKVEAVNPPFDLSQAAFDERGKLYNIDGRANLSGEDTPLKEGMKISVFGDSITWQNVFVSQIQSALDNGAGTQEKGIEVINRGINGGGVLSVRDGVTGSAYPGDTAQASFSEVIASDEADIAVVFIGVNDVGWRNTSEQDFRLGLQNLADQAAQNGTKLVFASPTVRSELPDGSNPDDAEMDAFTGIMKEVAEEKSAEFVNLREAFIAYEKNFNWELQLDGSLIFQQNGILTYDGIHPNATGNELLADLISQGIFNAAAVPEPSSMGLLGAGSLLLARRNSR